MVDGNVEGLEGGREGWLVLNQTASGGIML
jgi:hypothetical protein